LGGRVLEQHYKEKLKDNEGPSKETGHEEK